MSCALAIALPLSGFDYFDGKVRAAQFALAAGDAFVGIGDVNLAFVVEGEDFLGAEGHADAATFAVFLGDIERHVNTS
jgi:hypothetical protein